MTNEKRKEAVDNIEGQLNNGYIDLDEFNYKNEFEIIKEAMKYWNIIEKFNSITSYHEIPITSVQL